MNKNFYRLIYSKTRGMLIAVAEFTCAHRSGAAAAGETTSSQQLCKLTTISFGIMLALGAVQPAQANIVADGNAPAGQQPAIIANPGMATQIDIQAPSAAGVSRNSYSQFDVDRNGVILNNSQHGAMTQLAGEIAGNQALAQGAAKIILNEVNSANPSQLNGMIEVAGQQAQVVITNPSGISCDGCGFINTSRATLSTGQAQLENGALTGYKVEGGEIVVQGAGMNSSASYTDIIARAVKVNSALQTRELKITTGRNHVDAANEQIAALEDETNARPELALDVSSMGGMYAGKIILVGTEKGVGVNNAGMIYTHAGSVILNVDGSITNSGIIDSRDAIALAGNTMINEQQAAILSGGETKISVENSVNNAGLLQSQKSVKLTATSVHNSGDLNAAEEIDIDARGHVANERTLTAGKNLNLTAASYSGGQESVLQAGSWAERGDITLKTSGKVSAAGRVQASGDWVVTAENIDLADGQNQADNIDLQAGAEVNLHGAGLAAGQRLLLQASKLAVQGGNLSGNSVLIATDSLTNAQGKISGNSVAINAESVHNSQGDIISSGDMKINSAYLSNQDGTLYAENTLSLIGNSLRNDRGYIAGQQLAELAIEDLTNSEGSIYSSGNITINSSGNVFNNGNINAVGDLVVVANGEIANAGKLNGNRELALTADRLVNAGSLTANGDINITAATLDSKAKSLISAGEEGDGNLKITTSGSLTANGTNSARGTLQLRGEDVDLSGSLTRADKLIIAANNTLTTSEAALYANVGIELAAKEINNQLGFLSASTIDITSDRLNNQQGSINAYGEMQLAIAAIDNGEGTITVAGKEIQPAEDVLPQEEGSGEYVLPTLEVTGNEWAFGPALDALREIKAAMSANQINWRPKEAALRNVINYLYVALEKGYEIDEQMINALARSALGATWTEDKNVAMASIANIVKTHWQNGKVTPPGNEESVIPPVDKEEIVTPPVEEEETVMPPVEEEEAVTPPIEEEDAATPPVEEEETVMPPVEEEEAVTPSVEEEETVTPPVEEEETVMPPVEEEETVTPPVEEEETVMPPVEEEEIVTPPVEEEEAVTPSEQSEYLMPIFDITDSSDFDKWDEYSHVLNQIRDSLNPGIISHQMLKDVVHYMYKFALAGNEFNDAAITELAKTLGGMFYTEEQIGLIKNIAQTVTENRDRQP